MYMMEKVLWEVGSDREKASAFNEAPDDYLAGFRLEPDEKQMLKSLDVRRIADREVSTLLLFGAWLALRGPKEIGEYLGRMNTPAA